MKNLRFEWDENKNRTNQRKHNVSFDEAKTVFYDKNSRLIPDPFQKHLYIILKY